MIYQFSAVEGAEAFEAELRAIRAFWYYHLMDMYGNVPLSIDFTDTEAKGNTPRASVYSWIMSELDAVINLLPTAKDGSTYGRMNKWAALALRHKMKLNAGVYTGAADWAGAKADADAIIASGKNGKRTLARVSVLLV